MALAFYLIFLGGACAFALVDWRRAWLLVIVCGVIQDPVRKLTGGAPVWVSFLVVLLYGVILFGARNHMREAAKDFAQRFRSVSTGLMIFIFLLLIAAINGLVTYGIDKWKAPLVSFITYLVPMIAALFGYTWADSEERIMLWCRLYAAFTSVALIGTVFEYMRVQWPIFGMVSFAGDYIRHLPGIQIRMLSGVYRGPDVMAWHAGMVTAIGVAMVLRSGLRKQTLVWAAVASWGFFNCMIAGRRKAIYFVVVFAGVFLWRYIKRVQPSQAFATLGLLAALGTVVNHLSSSESTSIYTRSALASGDELGQRLEGGAMQTFREVGYMGAGLGTATQGVHHLLGSSGIGWQEGGLGKVAMEIGLPGLLCIFGMGLLILRLLMHLTRLPDVRGSSQFVRVLLFAFAAANFAGFMASAQAYTDAVLGLTAGFLVGALFASAALDERLVERERSLAERDATEGIPQLTPQPSAL